MNDADGFRLEAAEQFGAQMIDTDGREDYVLTEAQLIAFAKSCERAGRAEATRLVRRELNNPLNERAKSPLLSLLGTLVKRNKESDAELAPLLEAERQRCLTARETPTFSTGKTYMTKGGQAMRIERWSGADGRYATEQSRRPVWYREDGKCDVREWSHYDLVPGAIPDALLADNEIEVTIWNAAGEVVTHEVCEAQTATQAQLDDMVEMIESGTPARLAATLAKQEQPDPALCEGGEPITSDPCELCGATMDDLCRYGRVA